MNIPWADLELFLAVVESKSLSKAARLLKVTQPTVSRRLSELETMLGEPLFVRSVEGVAPTSFGESLVLPARRMAENAAELERAAAKAAPTPTGIVRITAPPGVAYQFLTLFAADLRDALPEVELEVIAAVNYVDLVRREADIAIRLQPLDRASSQRDLVQLAMCEQRVAAFGTREFIAKLPRGYRLADVGFVGWTEALSHLPPNPQLAALIPGFRPVFASDDYIVQLRAAEAGVGAIVLGVFRSTPLLPSPLVELALPFGNTSATLRLVAARSSLAIPRVKAVADILAHELGRAAISPKPRSKDRAQ